MEAVVVTVAGVEATVVATVLVVEATVVAITGAPMELDMGKASVIPGRVSPAGSSATGAGKSREGAQQGAGEGAIPARRAESSSELLSSLSSADIKEIVHVESAENKLERLEGVISLKRRV